MNELELYDACRVLFGKEVRIDRQFLEYIQPSGVKSAYRKMALATHPDRFAVLGHLQPGTGDFRMVADAYEKLSKYLKLRESGYRLRASYNAYSESGIQRKAARTWNNTAASTTASTSANNNSFSNKAWKTTTTTTTTYYGGSDWQNSRQAASAKFSGYTQNDTKNAFDSQKTSSYSYQKRSMPRRKLRIGEYLYYSGVVAWKDLIASITWQTKQRQRIGEIARRWGWLTEGKILEIMKSRNRGERLGDALVRLKIITPFQCNMLVWQQQRSQSPIGKYFTAGNILSENDLNHHLTNLKSHNNNVANPDQKVSKPMNTVRTV